MSLVVGNESFFETDSLVEMSRQNRRTGNSLLEYLVFIC